MGSIELEKSGFGALEGVVTKLLHFCPGKRWVVVGLMLVGVQVRELWNRQNLIIANWHSGVNVAIQD